MKKRWIIGIVIIFLLIFLVNQTGEEDKTDEDKIITPTINEKMTIIKVYPDENLIESDGVAVADIIVNDEIGEIIVSSTLEGEALSSLNGALDAALESNLTLEFEEFNIIDGDRVLAMKSKFVNPTDDEYVLPLRYFLSFDYEWDLEIFEFDLVEAKSWSAYTTTDYNQCLPPGVEGLVDESSCKKADRLTKVLEFENRPGYLVSTGYFPDVEPVTHPFLNAVALTPDEEDTIGGLIRESSSFVEFLSKLVENEYLIIGEGKSLLR
ncbi:hypothetical protein ISS07_00020 [Candidatus Woesearchaeota archaeon]|nr:hypothetical protein [Candidatus Woesearchaeota archaeon]